MRYWSYGSLVLSMDEKASYRDIVDAFRQKVGRNIMWEEIKECDIEDYIAYLEENLQRANNEAQRLHTLLMSKADFKDIDKMYVN